MKNFEINGKEYGMTVNLGTLLFAEQLNKGIDPKDENRTNLGFALACFYGADKNCDLTLEDLIATFGATKAKYMALLAAVKEETDRFNGINDEMADEEEGAQEGEAKQKKG